MVARQYLAYNGKLLVISLDDSYDCPAYLFAFLAEGERPLRLSFVIDRARPQGAPVVIVGKDEPDLEELDREVVDIVVKIQQRWRQILKRQEHHRKLMATTTGPLLVQLIELCHERFTKSSDSASVSPEERARIRKLVLVDGIEIISDLAIISTSLRQLKEEWKVRIDDPLVAAEDIEELDNLHGQIGAMEAKLNDAAETWSLKGLAASIRSTPSKTLNQQARQAQRQIVAARQEIEVIRDHIQNVGSHETM